MINIFGWVLAGVLGFLLLVELGRYLRAARDPEELPYPRLRLIRRMILGTLLIAIIILGIYFGAIPVSAWIKLLAIPVLFSTALVLWLKDLSETSKSVVEYARRLDRETDKDFQKWIRDKATEEKPEKKS